MTKDEHFRHPGRRLALCVAPYFADRGVGDMRGDTNGTPICHPGGGGRPSLHTQPCGTQDDTHRTTAEAQPRTTSGVRLCTGAIWHAPHVASPTRGEIRGFARRQPPPGWRNARLRSSSRCVGRCAASAEGHNVACLIVTTLHLRSCSGVGEVPPKTACQRYAPSPTIPPRHYTHRRIHDA